MNLETILHDTYYIQIHKLTTIEYLNIIIMNWHRTLKCPAHDLSLESANRDLPSCDLSQVHILSQMNPLYIPAAKLAKIHSDPIFSSTLLSSGRTLNRPQFLMFKPLKPNGNYIYQLLQHSVTAFCSYGFRKFHTL
jgi:hypothetical protein